MTTLSIDILDAASGKMAEGVHVQTRKIVDGGWQSRPEAITDSNGRAVLGQGAEIGDGGYFELLVMLGAYFDQTGRDLPQIKLIDIIPLRFGLEAAVTDVSIQLSVTPHGYSSGFSARTTP